MIRFMCAFAVVGILAFTTVVFINTRTAIYTDRSASNASRAGQPFGTRAGGILNIPAGIPLQWSDSRWNYSPDGTKLAFPALGTLWIWNFATGEVKEVKAAVDDDQHGAGFSNPFWTDNDHILAAEHQNSYTEAAAFSVNHDLPLPSLTWRRVLLDVTNGQRVRCINDKTNGNADGLLEVVGVIDKDIWYIKARDGQMRKYDSRVRSVSAEAYFDYNVSNGYAVQVAPGSSWFTTLVPSAREDHNHPFRGRLDVFNLETGQKRSIDDIYLPVPPALVTPDGRFLFTVDAGGGADGLAVPKIYDLVESIAVPLPQGERWLLWTLSASRGVLLVGFPPSNGESTPDKWIYAEVPLSRLIQY